MKQLIKRLGLLLMDGLLLLSGCKADAGQENRNAETVNAATTHTQGVHHTPNGRTRG